MDFSIQRPAESGTLAKKGSPNAKCVLCKTNAGQIWTPRRTKLDNLGNRRPICWTNYDSLGHKADGLSHNNRTQLAALRLISIGIDVQELVEVKGSRGAHPGDRSLPS
jgi:hypothetical protein